MKWILGLATVVAKELTCVHYLIFYDFPHFAAVVSESSVVGEDSEEWHLERSPTLSFAFGIRRLFQGSGSYEDRQTLHAQMKPAQTSQAGHHQLGPLELTGQRSAAVGPLWSLGTEHGTQRCFHVTPSQNTTNSHLDSGHKASAHHSLNAENVGMQQSFFGDIFRFLLFRG